MPQRVSKLISVFKLYTLTGLMKLCFQRSWTVKYFLKQILQTNNTFYFARNIPKKYK